jgi:mRNA-degrading endonuclease RelE of RelBE toxin-antitoxin system
VRFEIIFSPEAAADIATFRASDRAKVFDAIETFLRHEPEKISKSRIKRLQGLQRPQYRLRVDDLRVFYDVSYTDNKAGVVEILRIWQKSAAIQWLAKFGKAER